MANADAKSHASLNGLYIKARELNQGRVEDPTLKLAPPGQSIEADGNRSFTQASTHASNSQASPSTNASKRGAGQHMDASSDFALSFNAKETAYTLSFFCFDTPNYIKIYGYDSANRDVEMLLLDVWRACLHMHKLWSFSTPRSDIHRANRRELECEVDTLTATLIRSMKDFHEQEPLFDFTVGPLSFLWKHAKRVPTQQRIEKAKESIGAEKVHVEGCCITKQSPYVKIDVGGAAKGAAADMIAASLRSKGVRSAEINLGGNLFLLGEHPEGRAWNVDIKIPEGIQAEAVRIEAKDESVVTSGSYERFVEIDGKRYQHIVDPRTGWPSTSDIVSATVVSKSSLQADMLATTTLLASSSGFDKLRARHPECRIIAICADGRILRG